MATVIEANSLKVSGKHQSRPGRALAQHREGNTQTYKSGALLIMSAGLLVEATSPVGDTEIIAGVAQQDGQNVSTKPLVGISPALPGEVFDGILGNSGDDLFVLGDNRVDVGKAASLIKDAANGGWYLNASTDAVDAAGVANARVRVVGVVDETLPLTGNTKVNPRVFFVFLDEGRNAAAGGDITRPTLYA